VFQSEGSAVEHIPPDLRGVLGMMSSGVRDALKQRLKASILKAP
jgi:hypothetical protein